jgi:hypothetical protein
MPVLTTPHIEVASACVAIMTGVGTIAWRIYKAGSRAAERLAQWVDDRMAITAAQISAPIVEAQDAAKQMIHTHLEDCRQDRANTRVRVHALERQQSKLEMSVIELAGRTTPTPVAQSTGDPA